MSFGLAFLSGHSGEVVTSSKVDRVPVLTATFEAYKFLLKNFAQVLRPLLVPVAAAGLVLYMTLNRYLAGLLSFLETPDTRVATLTLGMLAAGLFLSLFCYAVAVSAISDLALGKPAGDWLPLRMRRQEWRIYAAYLRLLLLLSLVLLMSFVASAYLEPLLSISPAFGFWMLMAPTNLAIVFLFARIGFLIPPIVATSEGAILRTAFQSGAGDLVRNCVLLALLLVPGILVLVAAGYVFRMYGYTLPVVGTLPLADAARSVREMLGPCLIVLSLSLSLTIALFTVGAVTVYQRRPFVQNALLRTSTLGPSLGRPLPAEGPPK